MATTTCDLWDDLDEISQVSDAYKYSTMLGPPKSQILPLPNLQLFRAGRQPAQRFIFAMLLYS